MKFKAILFDLDGTLIDSASDLGLAADQMRIERHLPSLPIELYRPMAGAGARGMLKVAFDMSPEHPEFLAYREEFFSNYEARMTLMTYAFDGVDHLLDSIKNMGLKWGIVTNKSKRFTDPLVMQMPVLNTSSVNISGDTTAFSKPHPEPLFEAARRLQLAPHECVYVGDDKRDIEAALAAGMPALAACWGYMGEHAVQTWGAHALLEQPLDLLTWLDDAK